ncbi:MAG: VOC family protein [Acidobacteria bacterium]|nr:VOC family protein [Acidobacteriota bacterium]
MKRAVAFYRDVLGIALRYESEGWSEFATEGTTLALHPAGETGAGRCQPGFVVEDIGAFHQNAQANGVRCIMPPKKQDFGGVLAAYADPDGLIISIMEAQKK